MRRMMAWIGGAWRGLLGMALAAVVLVAPLPALAGEAEALAGARKIIAGQIAAFQKDDGPTAFSFAAPEIQAMFQTPDVFMGMVRNGYQPVYRPRSYEFQPGQVLDESTVLQRVDILGPDGNYWVAEYVVRTLPDGSLRIGGCRLIRAPGAGA